MNTKISIIVPVYNSEKFLEKTIQSILQQSFNEFELILINDGSTDKSEEICLKYQMIDKRIRLITTKNLGVSAARNTGIKIARGDYIGFVDSDDYIHRDMYKELFESCIKIDADIGIIGLSEVDMKGRILSKYYPQNVSLAEILKRAYPCNKLFKKTLFYKYNLFFIDNRYYEDVDLIAKLYVKSKKVCVVNKIRYYYVKHESSTTASRDNRILDNLWAYLNIKKFLLEEDLFEKYRDEFKEGCVYFKKYYLNIIYDYPTIFLIKNSAYILNGICELDNLTFKEFSRFIIKHLNFIIKKNCYSLKEYLKRRLNLNI